MGFQWWSCAACAVFEAMNKVPEAQHGTDIMRVREHFLSGNGAAYRQTIVLSSFASAEMNALFNRTCTNWAGRVKLRVDPQVGGATPTFCQTLCSGTALISLMLRTYYSGTCTFPGHLDAGCDLSCLTESLRKQQAHY